MKRTRQRFDRPEQDVPAYTSGCSQFEGEDLLYANRVAYQAEQQKNWCNQQIQEHQDEDASNKQQEADYAEQTAAITRMRGMLEDENTARKNAQLKALQEENKRLAQAKRDREEAWRNDQANKDAFELAATVNHGLEKET